METQKANGKPVEAIIPRTDTPLAVANNEDSVERQLARAEKSIAFRKGILRLIAANINPDHILLYGKEGEETLWLDKVACNRILSWAGARLEMDSTIQEKRYQGVEGPYMDFEVWGTVITEGDGRAVRVMGNRATFDDFYAKRTRYRCPREGCKALTAYGTGCPQHGQVNSIKEEYYLPLEEVDIPSIKQAAITNLWNKAVAGLGFTPTVQELKDAGLDLRGRKRVKFNSGKQEAADNEPAKTQPVSTQAPSGTPTASKAAAKPVTTPGNAAAAPKSAVPKAQIPKDDNPPAAVPAPADKKKGPKPEEGLRTGVVTTSYLNQGAKGRYVKLTLNDGTTLFCFHDSVAVTNEGDKNLLDLLVWARNKHCTFIVKKSAKGETIEGARKIGPFEWDTDGMPVLQREAGDEPF